MAAKVYHVLFVAAPGERVEASQIVTTDDGATVGLLDESNEMVAAFPAANLRGVIAADCLRPAERSATRQKG